MKKKVQSRPLHRWPLGDGGIERGTKKMFMEVVAARNAATLLPLIQRNVAAGSPSFKPMSGRHTYDYQHLGTYIKPSIIRLTLLTQRQVPTPRPLKAPGLMLKANTKECTGRLKSYSLRIWRNTCGGKSMGVTLQLLCSFIASFARMMYELYVYMQ